MARKFKERLDDLRKWWKHHEGRAVEGFGMVYRQPLKLFERDIAFFRALERETLADEPKHAHRYIKFPFMIRRGKAFVSQICVICGKSK